MRNRLIRRRSAGCRDKRAKIDLVANEITGKGRNITLVINNHVIFAVRKASSGAPGVPPVPVNRNVTIAPFISAADASYW